MADARLILENTSYWREGGRILDGLHWRVEAGQHWAVLGPNGSGKTTLLQIVTGYLPSSQGQIFLLDGYIRDLILPNIRPRLGFVSGALTEHMVKWRERTTGLEVVLSGLYASLGLFQSPPAEKRDEARALLREMGAESLSDRIFRVMSTGERQICFIARAQLAPVELVFLDEPCAGLDMAMRERVLRALEASCGRRPDVPNVLVTHHTEEIVPSITHVLLLRSGRVVAQGPKDEVLTAENISRTFDWPVRLEHRHGRAWALPES